MNITPGPWTYHDLGDDWCFSGPSGTTSVLAPERKPSPANARAIAEVPAMIEALKNIREKAIWQGAVSYLISDDLLDPIRAILKRIEG